MRQNLRLLAVGRAKNSWCREAAADYIQRLARWRDFSETLIKDADPALPPERRKDLEGRALLAALRPGDIPVCLDEHGKTFSSRDFASFLASLSTDASRCPCFIIGGPFGLAPSVLAAARHTLALGPMTLPHELARVVLLEQLYRAESILRHLPYHHE